MINTIWRFRGGKEWNGGTNQQNEKTKKTRFVNYKKRSTPSVEYFQFRPRRITKPVISNYVLLCTHGRMNCIDVQTSVGLCGTSKNYRNIPSNADCNLDSAPVTCNKVVRIIYKERRFDICDGKRIGCYYYYT